MTLFGRRCSMVRFAIAGLCSFYLGCQPPAAVEPPTGVQRVAAPPPPSDPPSRGVRLLSASDTDASDEPGDQAHETDIADTVARPSGAAVEHPRQPENSDEAAVRSLLETTLAAAEAGDGNQLLACYHPAERNATLVRLAQTGYLLHGPDSEAGRIAVDSGLLAEKYQAMFRDLADNDQIDAPANQALVDEAAERISDPQRLISLVTAAMIARAPPSRSELILLSVDGSHAAGVRLIVTAYGTSPAPFAAAKVDGRWYIVRTSAAAEAKVKQYQANPTAAAVSAAPRRQIRITAEELSREFRSDPTAATQKYGGPGGFVPGPFGGPPRDFAPLVMPSPPAVIKNEIILEATFALRESIRGNTSVYLVTPRSGDAIQIATPKDSEAAARLAKAETGQKLSAVIAHAQYAARPSSGPGIIVVATQQVEIHGEPAEPAGPLSVSEFLQKLSDPTTAGQLQGRPIILEGNVVVSMPQAAMVGLGDGSGESVGAILQETQLRHVQALQRGQPVRLKGVYVPPAGSNQPMLRACVFESDDH